MKRKPVIVLAFALAVTFVAALIFVLNNQRASTLEDAPATATPAITAIVDGDRVNRAIRQFEESMTAENMNTQAYQISAREFVNGHILITRAGKFKGPPEKFIRFDDGRIEPLSAHTLSQAFRLRSCKSQDEKITFIKEFIGVSGIGVGDPVMINRIKDIPNYSISPLDPKIEAMIQPPQTHNETVTVYTYSSLTRVVSRYRFVFSKTGQFENATCEDVAFRAGAPAVGFM